MREPPPLSIRIEAWTREALLTWGDDWPRVREHIERQMTAMGAKERRDVADEATLTLIGADEGARH